MKATLVGTPVLKDGTLYIADNGRVICSKCAGMSALYTGRDISGQKVGRLGAADDAYWVKQTGKHLCCENGCTAYAEGLR